jgi:hypothetical protein
MTEQARSGQEKPAPDSERCPALKTGADAVSQERQPTPAARSDAFKRRSVKNL